MTFNKANPDLSTDTPDSLTTYTIGDDVIAQKVGSAAPQYLLYDGHGSTRQLAGYASGTGVTIAESYSYDGYGVLLQDENTFAPSPGLDLPPGYTPPQATSLLYSGEMFDADAQQYYLRARYYNPLNGLFNQTDPYAGNTSDPQSLHKYAYVHNNPVNGIDPSGLMGDVGFLSLFMAVNIITCLMLYSAATYLNWSHQKKSIEKNPELWNRTVNPRGIWLGYVGGAKFGFVTAGLNLYSGKIYRTDDTKINTFVGITGLRAGLGYGGSFSGGLLVVFNARSLKEVSETEFMDLELNADFAIDLIPEALLVKLGLSADELNELRKVAKFMKAMPDNEVQIVDTVSDSIDVMKDRLGVGDGKPKAICVTFDSGLQLFAGMSGNKIYVDNPSFK